MCFYKYATSAQVMTCSFTNYNTPECITAIGGEILGVYMYNKATKFIRAKIVQSPYETNRDDLNDMISDLPRSMKKQLKAAQPHSSKEPNQYEIP